MFSAVASRDSAIPAQSSASETRVVRSPVFKPRGLKEPLPLGSLRSQRGFVLRPLVGSSRLGFGKPLTLSSSCCQLRS